jgi:hypothetical protein
MRSLSIGGSARRTIDHRIHRLLLDSPGRQTELRACHRPVIVNMAYVKLARAKLLESGTLEAFCCTPKCGILP